MRRFIYMGAMLALAGCSANGGPRPSSTNYIEPPAAVMPGPAPNLGLQPSRMPHMSVAKQPRRCPPGQHWVKAYRAPGALRKVPGHCR